MLVGLSFVNVLNYLYHFIMVKLLVDPTQYGELVALISLMALLGIIPGSFNLVIIKYISAAKTDQEVSQLTKWFADKGLKLSLLFFVFTISMSPLISSFLHISNVWFIVAIGISFIFSIPTLLNRAVLQGLLKFKEMIFSLIIENGFKLVLGVIFVYIGLSVSGAMLGLLIALIIGWYITKIYIGKYSQEKRTLFVDVKSILKFSIPTIVYSFATTSLYTSDIILVKHFFSAHDAGLYAALSTLSKIILFGAGPIGAVMFPLVSRKHSRGENYRKVFLYSLGATLVFGLLVLLIYWIFPGLIITLLFKSAYSEINGLLVWFGLFITLFTLALLLTTYSLSLGRTKVVVLPLIAAISQIVIICFNHQTLFSVILTSTMVATLLLASLLIYFVYEERNH